MFKLFIYQVIYIDTLIFNGYLDNNISRIK